ncbi:MAG TPA: hypothetical protein VGR57_04550, partial [Ktedonobacterales bacterium]|nr:hypothetical protein [Ktedonobacterales bacterium]
MTLEETGREHAPTQPDVADVPARSNGARKLADSIKTRAAAAWQALAARPATTLAGIGALLIAATVVQGGMSERLRTTWHLANVLDYAVSVTMPLGGIFELAVARFPRTLPGFLPAAHTRESAFLMAMWGYFFAVALLFALYALALRWVSQHAMEHHAALRVVVWVAVIVATVAYFTPAVPSHDAFAYAMSGRLILTYHANPFFAVPGSYPRDPILQTNEWPLSATAYGPLWSVISVLVSPLVGANPLSANLVYRALAYAAHLANIALIVAIARQLAPQRPSWHALGLLLYAWNPLVIVEVAAGHNDVMMLTGLLAGIYLLGREWRAWAMVAFAAAILLKISALPLVALVLLGIWLREAAGGSLLPTGRAEWLRRLTPAALVTGVVALGYLPFYIGHSLREIAAVANLQPTSQALARALKGSFATLSGSIMGVGWLPRPLATRLASGAMFFDLPLLWTLVLLAIMGATTVYVLPLLRRIERVPAALAWVYASWMAFLSVFHLLRTWYLIPLLGLVCLAPVGRPIRRFT